MDLTANIPRSAGWRTTACPAIFCLVFASLGACATTESNVAQDSGNMVGDAVQQPFRDLNLIRDELPPILAEAAERPYDVAGLTTCVAVAAKIKELEALLGPDVDTGITEEGSDAVAIASDALQGLLGLPFRGVVRRITGAHDRDRAIRLAVLAGMVRRGFLKGLAEERGCPATDQTAA